MRCRDIAYAHLTAEPQPPHEWGAPLVSAFVIDGQQQPLWQVDMRYFKCWTGTNDKISTGTGYSADGTRLISPGVLVA